ncbi:ABC transporter substrate-binding protein [soil metagenome]
MTSATLEHTGLGRRDILMLGCGVGALAIVSACNKVGGIADPVLRASVTGKGDGDTRLLLKTAGIVTEGFRVDYSEFQSGHLVVEAFNGGALDYGGMSEIPPIFAAASSEQNFRQIAIAHGDVNNQVVLIPRGSRIASLADLKGKRVGYVQATTSQYFLIRMLHSVGLEWSDITPIAMNVSDGMAAFSSGALDAWAIYGFPIQRAIAVEGATILKTALGFLSGNYIVVASVKALADPAKVELIGKYLRDTQQAYAWAVANQDIWAKAIAKEINVPLAYVQDQFRRKSDSYTLRPVTEAAIASQQEVADLFAQQKLVPKAIDVRPLWDNRFNSILQEKL